MRFLDTLFNVYRNKGENFTHTIMFIFKVDAVTFEEIENNPEIMEEVLKNEVERWRRTFHKKRYFTE